jgi:predicted amidohydrolase YtcJ
MAKLFSVGVLGAVSLAAAGASLQDISRAVVALPPVTIYPAREVITLDPEQPHATAIAVVNGRILGVGSEEELITRLDGQPHVVDPAFADQVVVPGFIAQHDHPFLTGLTMMSEIIAIEDWVLPAGTVPAARNREEYLTRLTEADARLADPTELLFTWGFHHYFHGKLTRADLDAINTERPILVWHRSAHEFILNSAALELFEVTPELLAGWSESAQAQSNLEEGHFWEQGVYGLLPKLGPHVATPERIRAGLEFMVDYFHTNGLTLGCEPGGLLSESLQRMQNEVLSDASMPFRFYFIPDGKTLVYEHPDNIIGATEDVLDWGEGMTAMVPGQVKLFADGAIYSQLMQMREPYTDGHEGEWMMDLHKFAHGFRTYWEAGYQMHIHVNGDAGLDMVLDNLEENMRRHPRTDHRTVIVHFAVSSPDQVVRIKELGAIVSANPYYPIALADRYGEYGLGPERADPMARLGDVERAGISYSCHSDMPMAPAQPLFLMHCAVNRVTTSGRVAAPEQRVSREGALRSVTLEAAYSLRMEDEVGSIERGKLANFTILGDNPVTCDPEVIKDIPVWGTVHEGRVLPVEAAPGMYAHRSGSLLPGDLPSGYGATPSHRDAGGGVGCSCSTGKKIAELLLASAR